MNFQSILNIKKFLRIFIGIFFVVSAILKLESIDSFEIYIYSLNFFNLNLSFLFARVIISIELFIGIILIIGIYLKIVTIFSIILLVLFSGFLITLLLTNNPEHCQCFGDKYEMSHSLSILKNVILIILLYFLKKSRSSKIRYSNFILISCIILSMSIPMIVSPPDFLLYKKYSSSITYNESLLNDFIEEGNHNEGRKIVCFFGISCRYCKLAAKKTSVIAKANKSDLFYFVFWGSDKSIKPFLIETNTVGFKYSQLSSDMFLRITNGTMPLIFFLDNGKVKNVYNYRSMKEKEFIDFINNH